MLCQFEVYRRQICVSIIFQIIFSFRLLQSIEKSSVCYTVGLYWLSIFPKLPIYLLLVSLGLCRCLPASSSCSEWGLLFIVMHRFLFVVVSLLVEHRCQAHQFQQLQHADSEVAVWCMGSRKCRLQQWWHMGFLKPAARGIFLHQGLNLSPLHCQADSHSLYHQGSPVTYIKRSRVCMSVIINLFAQSLLCR